MKIKASSLHSTELLILKEMKEIKWKLRTESLEEFNIFWCGFDPTMWVLEDSGA